MANLFTCALCGEIFEGTATDEEVQTEQDFYWPDTPREECAVVCDACWQKIRPEKNKEKYNEYILESQKQQATREADLVD